MPTLTIDTHSLKGVAQSGVKVSISLAAPTHGYGRSVDFKSDGSKVITALRPVTEITDKDGRATVELEASAGLSSQSMYKVVFSSGSWVSDDYLFLMPSTDANLADILADDST